jgi:acetyl-CoA carboxylase biotin carboxyl carrier protein
MRNGDEGVREESMDLKDLRRIVELMNKNELVEVEIEQEGTRIRLRKKEGTIVGAAPAAVAAVPVAAPAPAPAAAPAANGGEDRAAADASHKTIAAPMVGTYYSAPSPDAEAYVSVGSKIGPDSVVCILEAMKVMNEIKAEMSGEIVKVCVQNGEAVEYGQPLYLVKPA